MRGALTKIPMSYGAGVCEQKRFFCASRCPAIQGQKLLSTPRFGALKACLHKDVLPRRSAFFADNRYG